MNKGINERLILILKAFPEIDQQLLLPIIKTDSYFYIDYEDEFIYLLRKYSERRAVKLLINNKDNIKNVNMLSIIVMEMLKDKNVILPKKPKSFNEILLKLKYHFNLKIQRNIKFKQFKLRTNKFDNYIMKQCKDNNDLIYEGYMLKNCIGDGEISNYINKGTILLILKQNNISKFCCSYEPNYDKLELFGIFNSEKYSQEFYLKLKKWIKQNVNFEQQ